MKRILALVEGQTEEMFVKKVLVPRLDREGIFMKPIVISTKKSASGKKFKGGISNYRQFKRELELLFYDRSATAITMMIDFYGIPVDFPGMSTLPATASCYEKVEHLERSLKDDFPDRRFLPYLCLHEFEALLLTAPDEIGAAVSKHEAMARLCEQVDLAGSPEKINDGPETHPAARIMELLPGYRKTLHGEVVATRIGLDAMRKRCPHFDEWVGRLESV